LEIIGMVQAPVKPLTLEAFLTLPETKPASEYIDGVVIQKPMPQGEHSTLQGELVSVINSSLKLGSIGRAFPELRCTFGGRSVVPDVTVFRHDRIPRQSNGRIENQFKIAPDWTIEILSPDQGQSKVIRNILHCIQNGTEMGWLLDPEDSCIFVYDAEGRVQAFEQADAELPVPTFAKTVKLTVGEVFGWLIV
jgi:Uma2 family endonuclease